MPHHPTITLKERPKIVVLKGRSKGPTVVLTEKTTSRIMWQYVDHGDGSLHLEASNPFGSAGTRYLVTKLANEPHFAPRFKFTRAIIHGRRCWRVSWLYDMGLKRLGFVRREWTRNPKCWVIVGNKAATFKTRSAAAAWLNS